MNKKEWWGVLVVLAVSALVLYLDLKNTPVATLLAAASKIVPWRLLLTFLAMFLSFVCEAGILRVLAEKPGAAKRSWWSYQRIPLIQALFNGITPMATGGQPSQLAAMVEMGMKGGRATSLLMMKFIIYQLVVLFAYLTSFIFGFRLVATKFAGLAIFILLGFLMHLSSIILLLVAMFAHDWCRKAVAWCMRLLRKFMKKETVDKLERGTLDQVEAFYRESQVLKQEKRKLAAATALTVVQLLLYYSIPYLTLWSLGLSASWANVTLMTIMIIMFMAVIPLPGASGGAEFSFQTLFASFIDQSGTLVLAMFIWRFATYFFGMLLGVIGWTFKPKKLQDAD